MENKNRRQTVLINWSFQSRMIGIFILVNVFLMVMFQAVMYIFLDSEINTLLSRTHITLRSVREMLMPILISVSLLNIFLSSLVIAAFVLFASFRIAGPLYRFHAITGDIADRNLDTFTKIRAGDQLFDLAEEMTRMRDTLAGDMASLAELAKAADSALEASLNGEARRNVEEIRRVLSLYTLPVKRG